MQVPKQFYHPHPVSVSWVHSVYMSAVVRPLLPQCLEDILTRMGVFQTPSPLGHGGKGEVDYRVTTLRKEVEKSLLLWRCYVISVQIHLHLGIPKRLKKITSNF